MDFYNFPDTLVLKITKYAYDVNHFMYIVYDNSLDKYIIRGQKLTNLIKQRIIHLNANQQHIYEILL